MRFIRLFFMRSGKFFNQAPLTIRRVLKRIRYFGRRTPAEDHHVPWELIRMDFRINWYVR